MPSIQSGSHSFMANSVTLLQLFQQLGYGRGSKTHPRLCYIKGGFQTLIDAIQKSIIQNNGTIHTNTGIHSITPLYKQFDRILLTIPTSLAAKLVPDLSIHYSLFTPNSPLSVPHIHAQVLILETNKPILNKTYWLNVTDQSYPFLAVVAHTNFMDKKYYGNKHITYIGNYLPDNHPYLKLSKEQLLNKFLPYIKRLNPAFRQLSIVNCQLFVAPLPNQCIKSTIPKKYQL